MIEIEEARERSKTLSEGYWQKVKERIKDNPLVLKRLGYIPDIYFKEMKEDIGGMYRFAGWIEINTRYFLHNDMRFIEEVVRHEISHAIAHRLLKSEGHDKGFYEVLTFLGGEHRRCLPGWVNDPVPNPGSEKKRYICDKCGRIHYLSQRVIKDVICPEYSSFIRLCVNCHNNFENFVKAS